MNKWIWAFVVATACLDVAFCYQCQGSMLDWESNPLARWAFMTGGIAGVVLFRGFWLAFAFAMSQAKTRWSWLVAPAWGAAHAYLLVTLLVAGPYVSALRTRDVHPAAERGQIVRMMANASAADQGQPVTTSWVSYRGPLPSVGQSEVDLQTKPASTAAGRAESRPLQAMSALAY